MDFVTSHQFQGNVLDYGCGKQPYRAHVESCPDTTYTPYDRISNNASVAEQDWGPVYPLDHMYDTILCTQVVQYIWDTPDLLDEFYAALYRGGVLVLTYPTNWPEVEVQDVQRFTKSGMEIILQSCCFEIERHEQRASITHSGFDLALGYGVIARKA